MRNRQIKQPDREGMMTLNLPLGLKANIKLLLSFPLFLGLVSLLFVSSCSAKQQQTRILAEDLAKQPIKTKSYCRRMEEQSENIPFTQDHQLVGYGATLSHLVIQKSPNGSSEFVLGRLVPYFEYLKEPSRSDIFKRQILDGWALDQKKNKRVMNHYVPSCTKDADGNGDKNYYLPVVMTVENSSDAIDELYEFLYSQGSNANVFALEISNVKDASLIKNNQTMGSLIERIFIDPKFTFLKGFEKPVSVKLALSSSKELEFNYKPQTEKQSRDSSSDSTSEADSIKNQARNSGEKIKLTSSDKATEVEREQTVTYFNLIMKMPFEHEENPDYVGDCEKVGVYKDGLSSIFKCHGSSQKINFAINSGALSVKLTEIIKSKVLVLGEMIIEESEVTKVTSLKIDGVLFGEKQPFTGMLFETYKSKLKNLTSSCYDKNWLSLTYLAKFKEKVIPLDNACKDIKVRHSFEDLDVSWEHCEKTDKSERGFSHTCYYKSGKKPVLKIPTVWQPIDISTGKIIDLADKLKPAIKVIDQNQRYKLSTVTYFNSKHKIKEARSTLPSLTEINWPGSWLPTHVMLEYELSLPSNSKKKHITMSFDLSNEATLRQRFPDTSLPKKAVFLEVDDGLINESEIPRLVYFESKQRCENYLEDASSASITEDDKLWDVIKGRNDQKLGLGLWGVLENKSGSLTSCVKGIFTTRDEKEVVAFTLERKAIKPFTVLLLSPSEELSAYKGTIKEGISQWVSTHFSEYTRSNLLIYRILPDSSVEEVRFIDKVRSNTLDSLRTSLRDIAYSVYVNKVFEPLNFLKEESKVVSNVIYIHDGSNAEQYNNGEYYKWQKAQNVPFYVMSLGCKNWHDKVGLEKSNCLELSTVKEPIEIKNWLATKLK
jgi:hypothetical protein